MDDPKNHVDKANETASSQQMDDSGMMQASFDTKSNESEEVKILKNEIAWAEKQQLAHEEEVIELKSLVEKLNTELAHAQIEVNHQEYHKNTFKSALKAKEDECKEHTRQFEKRTHDLTEELYVFKKKTSVLTNKINVLNEQLVEVQKERNEAITNTEILQKKLDLLISKNSEDLLALQESVNNAEAKTQSVEVEMLALADTSNRLRAELSNKIWQTEQLQQSLADEKQAFLDREAAMDEREKKLAEAEKMSQDEAKFKVLSNKHLITMEEEITRLHTVNKELRDKLFHKHGLPATLLHQEKSLCTSQHVKKSIKSFEDTNAELRKQLVLAQNKIHILENEMMECGLRPSKRNFLQPTLSSQNKQKVPFTPASSNKENASTPASSISNMIPLNH